MDNDIIILHNFLNAINFIVKKYRNVIFTSLTSITSIISLDFFNSKLNAYIFVTKIKGWSDHS